MEVPINSLPIITPTESSVSSVSIKTKIYSSQEVGIQQFNSGMLGSKESQLEKYMDLSFRLIHLIIKMESFSVEIIVTMILFSFGISSQGNLLKHLTSRSHLMAIPIVSLPLLPTSHKIN
jgi:hypothetical protein